MSYLCVDEEGFQPNESGVGRTHLANGVTQVGCEPVGAPTQMTIKRPRRVGRASGCTHGNCAREGIASYRTWRSLVLQLAAAAHERVRPARASPRIRAAAFS